MRSPIESEPLARLLVAERAGDAGLVRGARGEAEGRGRLVVAGEVGVEHRRVVGRDRAADAGGDELRQRVLRRATRRRRCGGSRAGRRRGRCRGRRAPRTRPGSSTARIPCRIRSAPSASSAPRTDVGSGGLAGVRDRAEPERVRAARKTSSYGSGGNSASSPPSPTPTTPRSRYRAAHSTVSRASSCGEAAWDVGRQAHLDAVRSRASSAPAQTPSKISSQRDAAPDALGRAEDPLEVDGAVRRRLRGVVDDHLAEVVLGAERVRREDPDLDEVARSRGSGRATRGRPGARSRCASRSRAASARAPSLRGGRAARSSGTRHGIP